MIIEVFPLFEGVSSTTLTAYLQDSSLEYQKLGDKPAVIICPGGAYIGITDKEAEPVALRFLAAGYQTFVLRYSIGAELARFPAPFIDAAKAIMLVRENAGRWGVKPDHICLCGFSTGGHVASILAATWQEEYLMKALNADNQLFKPNALILGYPLLDMYQFGRKNKDKSHEMQTLIEIMFSAVYGTSIPSKSLMEEWHYKNKITSDMPPIFMWITSEDSLVDVEEAFDFMKVLAANNVSYELHVFEKGVHGLSLGDQMVGYSEIEIRRMGNVYRWMELALNWLKNKLEY